MFPHCRAEKGSSSFQLALKIYSLSFILPCLVFQRNTWLEIIILYYYIVACYFNFLQPLAEFLHLSTSCIGLLFLPLKGQIRIHGFYISFTDRNESKDSGKNVGNRTRWINTMICNKLFSKPNPLRGKMGLFVPSDYLTFILLTKIVTRSQPGQFSLKNLTNSCSKSSLFDISSDFIIGTNKTFLYC